MGSTGSSNHCPPAARSSGSKASADSRSNREWQSTKMVMSGPTAARMVWTRSSPASAHRGRPVEFEGCLRHSSKGSALDGGEAVADGFDGHLGEFFGTAIYGATVVGEQRTVDVSVELDSVREVAVVLVGVSEVLGERHLGALGEGVGDGATESADGCGQSLVLLQLAGIDAEDSHHVVVGGDALAAESVG